MGGARRATESEEPVERQSAQPAELAQPAEWSSPRSRRLSPWCARVGGARGVPEAAELDGRVDEAVEDLGSAGGGVINRASLINITHKNNMSYFFYYYYVRHYYHVLVYLQ